MQELAVDVWCKVEGCRTEARRAGCSGGVGCHPHGWQGHQKALEAATTLHSCQENWFKLDTLDAPEHV